MSVTEILSHLKEAYGVVVTGQTARNWTKKGRQGNLLPEKPTKKQVDSFIGKVGTKLGRGRPCTK